MACLSEENYDTDTDSCRPEVTYFFGDHLNMEVTFGPHEYCVEERRIKPQHRVEDEAESPKSLPP